jgi:hypothetical protein
MPWRGPQFEGELPTLGYEILEALSEVLPSPADVDAPLIFTDEQARIVLRWYTIGKAGQFIYRRGCLEMAKGWGKSPLLGGVAIAELALPVLFAGWDAHGEPVARPWGTKDSPPPWIQIAAVSEDQTDNTYLTAYEMLVANDGRAADTLGIDVGRTRLYLKGRPGRFEPVTAASGSREGQRLSFAILDETHLWMKANKGVKLAATIRRNAAKMGGRTFETTNAPELGENSVAEQTGKDHEGQTPGLMFIAKRPAITPDPSWSDAALREAIVGVYGDARWIDPDRLVADVRDPATAWADSLRYYFNVRSAGAGKAVDPRRWDELAVPVEVPKGTKIGLGFKHGHGATVLRGCTAEGYSFVVGLWTPPAGKLDWSVPRADVNETVARAFDTWKVGRMLCDPPQWRTEVEEWAKAFGDEVVLAFETSSSRRFAPAVDRWLTSIREGTHTHDGDETTGLHVRAAHLRKVKSTDPDDDTRTMYVLIPGSEGGQIAAAVADVLSLEAAATMPDVPEESVAVEWV